MFVSLWQHFWAQPPTATLCTGTRRRRRLREADVVVRLRLSDVLRARLSQAAAMHGPAFQAAGAAMDPALASQLQAAVGGA